ncbi:MAG TPA: IS30 family transposase [Allosphingosinicella sp.]|nr:IS30 family transposase [Allosphingosinicella sp.]
MPSYRQLSIEERCEIARLHEGGQSIRQIAAALDRQPSTVSRELKRNKGSRIGYSPTYAQRQASARRWSGSRLERDDALREDVLDRMADGWSPEQICGRLALDAGHPVISHETIYRFVHAQMKRTNDVAWRRYLLRGRLKRGWRNKGGGAPRFADRRSIHDRPAEADDRAAKGHWEADAMLFSRAGQAVLVAHERHSRITFLVRPPSLKAEPTATALAAILKPMPADMRRTITFDNGTEFARHYRLTRQLGIHTYFCDTRSPWQKGGVENAIGRLRRALPRSTDLDSLSGRTLDKLVARYNNTPRKCLGFQTPAETFLQPLHFKCESTAGSSPA